MSDAKSSVCESCGGEVDDDGMSMSMEPDSDSGETKMPPNSEDKSTEKSDLFAAAVKRSKR